MDSQRKILANILMIAFVTTQLLFFAASDFRETHIGVNYGTLGNNLPAPEDVINLFKKNGIKFVRIYDPNPAILNAIRGIRGSLDILVSVGTKNEDIPSLAQSPAAAKAWVYTNIFPFRDLSIIIVTVGNEVIPGPFATNVAQAMTNIKSALNSVGLSHIIVSTTTAFNLQTSFPPSAGAFSAETGQIMKDVTRVLRANSSPLLVSFYPYFAYASNPREISLEYATFRAKTPVIDGQLQYFSLLEAQMDAYYAALAAIGAGDIPLVIAETGWPTAGNEPYTSVANAQAYNANLINWIKSGKGTPRSPFMLYDAFIFATFDEDQKPAGIEQHFGIFSPNMKPKYPLKF